MGEPKIQIRDLGKTFPGERSGTPAIEKISLSISDGEFVSLVGPSGCGKSTALLCLAGLEVATGGEILLDGKPVRGPGPDRGIVFQEYALFPWRTVLQNVAYGLEVKGQPAREREQVARQYLALVGLEGFEHHYPHQLSGGMKQRVAVARALVVDPQVLLLDEPFAALDALNRSLLQKELVRIWQATQKTIVFVTHSITEAIFLSDRILLLTARPSRLKAEMAVGLPRPRDTYAPGFVRLQARLEELLMEEFRPSVLAGEE